MLVLTFVLTDFILAVWFNYYSFIMTLIKKIELNPLFKKALDLMEQTSQNLFVTGRAGTGKSTLLKVFLEITRKNPVVLAPTGVAAVNIGGQTIHSFFGFKPDVTLVKVSKIKPREENLYRHLKMIIIDEISMVRADLLDCVDKFLRLHGPNKHLPFGGVQMIFIGDLYQLSPVVTSQEKALFKEHYQTPYFFSSRVFNESVLEMEFIELEKVYRQKDDQFIGLLNAVRNHSATPEDLACLNQRWRPEFEPTADDFYIYLTATNQQADDINTRELLKITARHHSFQAKVSGDFGKEYLPTAERLEVKPGAQIMMLNNDSGSRWINGTVGKVLAVKKDEDGDYFIKVKLEEGEIVEVRPHTWDIYKYYLKGKEIQSETIGSFTQFPLRLAFAVTIHKSQGKTFAKVIIDLGRGAFAHGQTYVALSRCVSFEGIILKKAIKPSDLRLDWPVVRFLTDYQYALSARNLSLEDKIALIERAIAEKKNLEMIYLKGKDEKSSRTIKPLWFGEMEYKEVLFLGLEAFCYARQDNRTFNVERILELKVVE